ncbi:hypothetical protein BN2497_11067 [Janthinobacterium sp. CG23_2]|nr:hypothetical protein BN2497_11067 [Janthinobacterium sp. CG23_2]CUU31931.1 hypothetical protein BN3177_11067 [Janthinobacterium sp. CG23_2]
MFNFLLADLMSCIKLAERASGFYGRNDIQSSLFLVMLVGLRHASQ